MIVYGELLFIENMLIGGALLYLTAEIYGGFGSEGAGAGNGRRHGKLRLAAGAVMCGGFSLMIFLPVRMPTTLLLEAVFAVTVCTVVFGWEGDGKRADAGKTALRHIPWRKALTFLLVTYFVGGVAMALLLATDNTGIYTATGIYTGDMKAGLLALFVGISFVAVKQIVRTVRDRKFYREHVFQAFIAVDGHIIEAQAFFDTGNSLREPAGGRPVAVATDKLWQRLGECGIFADRRFCAVPYRTVNGKGILTGARTDYIEVGGRRIKDAVVAKGDGTLYEGEKGYGNCDLLLSKDMMRARL